MIAPLTTYVGASRSRRWVKNLSPVRKQKVRLRRSARRKDKQAVRIGDYETITRGQSDLDVS
jgi:hypothetical protein